MRVDIEYVRWLDEERRKINRADIEEITWYENGEIVAISQNIFDHWGYVGLSNFDFITGDFYKGEHWISP